MPSSAPPSSPGFTQDAGRPRGRRHWTLRVIALVAALGIGGAVTYAVTGSPGKSTESTSTTLAGAANQSASAVATTTTTLTPTFADLYQADVSGVVRIDASTCSGSGVGSGFLIS